MKRVAIVGTGNGWDRAPWDDPTVEKWGLNDGYLQHGPTRVCQRWWELHGDTPLTRARRPEDHFERVAQLGIPVYYLHGDPPPQGVKLDIDALAAVWRDYFACTNAYQIALAIAEGFEWIGLYGTPLSTAREVVVERPCVSAWLGFAEGRGIQTHVEHDLAVGLMRHPHRYAEHDLPEREATYWATRMVSWTFQNWLDREASAIAQARVGW